MSEMIERVALAISGGNDPANILSIHRYRARAAIEAMREPTDAMLDAEIKQSVAPDNDEGDEWRAMIDAALADQNTP